MVSPVGFMLVWVKTINIAVFPRNPLHINGKGRDRNQGMLNILILNTIYFCIRRKLAKLIGN